MSIIPDILNDTCTSLDGWDIYIDPEGAGTITVDDGFRTYLSGALPTFNFGQIAKLIADSPNEFTVEITTYFTQLSLAPYSMWVVICFDINEELGQYRTILIFGANGLQVYNRDEEFEMVSTDVKYGETAANQVWRFEINTITQMADIYLDGTLIGNYQCGIAEVSYNDPQFTLLTWSSPPYDQDVHVKSIKIGTGLGSFVESTDRYWIGNTGYWNDTAHWSYTSGGIGGAPMPTIDDDVFIDENSFTEPGHHIKVT